MVVYDAFSKTNLNESSLNECLEKGLPRVVGISCWEKNESSSLVCGFEKRIHIRIIEYERDTLKFTWIKNQNISDIEILKFTRLVFGLI